jgi:Protein of unknown function (DUF3027)
VSAATTRSRTPDRLCAEAVDLARSAAEEVAAPGIVGEHVSVVADGDRVVTHLFECKDFGYRGWRWAVTVARASRAKVVTLDETVLLPGTDALLAPEWVPWSERLRPGDMGPGDLLPTEADDLRLEPGYTGEDDLPPGSALRRMPGGGFSDEEEPGVQPPAADPGTGGGGTGLPSGVASQNLADLVEAEDAELTSTRPGADADATARAPWSGPSSTPSAPGIPDGAGGEAAEEAGCASPAAFPTRAAIGAVAEELGMGRARVLSRYGLHVAADRWDEAFGPKTPMAQAAPAPCASCGFLVPLAGSLRRAFGICANEYSPADGRVVSLAYGCGGHSEAAVMPKPPQPAPPVLDSMGADAFPLHPSNEGGSVLSGEESDASFEDLGHS